MNLAIEVLEKLLIWHNIEQTDTAISASRQKIHGILETNRSHGNEGLSILCNIKTKCILMLGPSMRVMNEYRI
jgi:hypothetical protein